MLILWKRSPFILWNSLILAFCRKIQCFSAKSLFYYLLPFFYGNQSLFSMKISLYSMEKLSHSACSKGYHLLNVENSDRHCIIFIELPNNGRRLTPHVLFLCFIERKTKEEYIFLSPLLRSCL